MLHRTILRKSTTFAQSRRHGGALVGLARPNKAPSPPKLKYETQLVSGNFVKFECQAFPART